jgi:putative ABC transport system substrate-binding protein
MWCSTVGCIVTLTLSILVAPRGADAQQAGKVWRVGFLEYTAIPVRSLPEAFQIELRNLGYVEGKNIVIEFRSAEGVVDRLGALATELARLPVDVIVAIGSSAIRAAQQATSTIPIIMMTTTNAVEQGFVASLARPGGNITGLAGHGVELGGKRLEMLKEAMPAVSRIAVLWNPHNRTTTPFLHETQAAAPALRVELQVLEVRTPNDFEDAFAAALKGRAEALLVIPDTFLTSHCRQIVDFAHRHRLPAMYYTREYVDAGGLMSYGNATWGAMLPRAAVYVDKILKGTKPADLPVERPTKLELIINLKTAQVLEITVPPTLLIWADEVIK